MKRKGNIYNKLISIENLRRADKNARKGKGYQYGIKLFDRNADTNLLLLHESLLNKTYRTSQYTTKTVYEPKERLVYRLPYYPDRIVHHAVMILLEPVFVSTFTTDTYSCIKKKGISAAVNAVKKALTDVENTTYCLKIDVKKFYPSIDHDILKALLRKKFKDNDLLDLLDEIIDSAPGLPIGNYLSQYLANFYLTYFDHWIKEVKKVKYYFRYADDMVILSGNKAELHILLSEMNVYLAQELKLTVKQNYQVFQVEARGIDFLGFVFRHNYIRMRKSIKKRFCKAVKQRKNRQSISGFLGWAKPANTKHLLKKLFNDTNQIV
jgi:retron-type reverse transcriptase